MNPTELMSRLNDEGVAVVYDGTMLHFRPASRIPTELLPEVKAQADDLAALIRPPISVGQRGLHSRLQKGLDWLTTIDRSLKASEAVHGRQVEQWAAALDLWGRLEDNLRRIYDYRGCAMGEGQHCPSDSAVLCAACERGK